MDQSIDRRLLIYVSGTFVVTIFVALMLLPLGLPYFEHIIGYWWAEPYFKMAVGQEQKMLWYKKAFFSFLFLFWVFGSAWASYKVLQMKRTKLLLAWAYLVFFVTVAGSQFLVLGDWKTHAYVNLIPTKDDCPSIVKVVDGIDSVTNFMRDMPKYAGVNGILRGTLATKAPAYVLMFYFIDKVTSRAVSAIGLDATNLAIRDYAMAFGFTLLIGLFLFPSYFLLRLLFSDMVANVGVLILAMNPLVASAFVHLMGLSHHMLIPVSSLALFLVAYGIRYNNRICNVAGVAIAALTGLVILESLALAALLVGINLVYLYRAGAIRKISRKLVLALVFGTLGATVLSWIAFRVAFGLDIFEHIWTQFVLTHIAIQFQRLFFDRGPIVFVLSIFTNVFCFLFFLGVPLAMQLYYSVREEWRARARKKDLAGAIIWGTLLFTLALDLTGLSTETSRLWAFLAPGFYVIAFSEFEKMAGTKKLFAIGLGIYILLGLQILIERNVHYTI